MKYALIFIALYNKESIGGFFDSAFKSKKNMWLFYKI